MVARGMYAPANHKLTENHSYAVVAKRVPHGVSPCVFDKAVAIYVTFHSQSDAESEAEN